MENVMKDLITIEEVCDLAQVSKPTVYRKVKVGEFPSPVKVPTTATRGPKMVNRWERGAILAWCFKNNAERLAVDVAVEETDAHWDTDHEPWYVKHKFILQAAVGGFLAAIAFAYFG
jgi:predicted DNA-binding transcriptional regulator AlpA